MLYFMTITPSGPDGQFASGATRPIESARWWALPVMLAVLVAAVAAAGWLRRQRDVRGENEQPTTSANDFAENSSTGWTPRDAPVGEAVGLSIDFGNGARREFDALPWQAGMTVADLMNAAREFRPEIAFRHQGEGASALLTSLEGVGGEGPGGRYWLYWVNDEPAHDSFGIHPLKPGDRVLWRFTAEEYNRDP